MGGFYPWSAIGNNTARGHVSIVTNTSESEDPSEDTGVMALVLGNVLVGCGVIVRRRRKS